jgi:SAM-dependent methyltransferase
LGSKIKGVPGRYLLDNRQPEAVQRLGALSELFDAVTLGHAFRLGLTERWSCWEVGAGGPGVPAALAEAVGPGGRVLATDLDPRWLSDLPAPVEVRQHELGVDPVPDESFDLVHARLLLVHLPRRDSALRALAAAVRPGGVLLVEEADPGLQPLVCPDESGEPERRANRLKDGFRTLMRERGVDLAFGRTLPRLLRDLGLLDVEADAYFPLTSPASAVLEQATVRQIRHDLVEKNLATDDDIDRHLEAVAGGHLDLATSPLVSCWGRKPVVRTIRSDT